MMENISDYMRKQSEANIAINEEMAQVSERSDEIRTSTEEQKVASDEIVKLNPLLGPV